MTTKKMVFQLLKDLNMGETCLLHVSSESMWPFFSVNDQVLVKRVPFNKVKRGDIIVFFSQEHKDLVVHRVIGLTNNLLKTKGDNTKIPDKETVNKEIFLGKVVEIHSNQHSVWQRLRIKLFNFFNNSRFFSHF